MGDVVLVDVDERIATITLNRAEARNALSPLLLDSLRAVLADCDERDDVDVMILTGADPAFCAGIDLKEMAAREGGRFGVPPGDTPVDPLPRLVKPVIGAVNGPAVTGGLELALACDFLVASERARFADTHTRVGVMPGWGLTVRLAEAVGTRRAREMSATGNFIDAETALTWGLVNHVVAHDDLLPCCRRLATDMVSNDAEGVQAIIGTYREQIGLVSEDQRALERRRMREWFDAGGGSTTEVAARRRAVVERGREQMR